MISTNKNNKMIKGLLRGWNYTLTHRYELLGSLKDKDLEFTPRGSKELQYQFACIGLTQVAYTKMLKKCCYISKYFEPLRLEFVKIRQVKKLIRRLKQADEEFEKEMIRYSDRDVFDWGGLQTPVYRIITLLQEHARLHHGQLITYFTLAKIPFPPGFKKDWNL